MLLRVGLDWRRLLLALFLWLKVSDYLHHDIMI